MKRILIDGRFVGVGESISRYTLELVKGILELDKENEYTLLVRPAGEKILNEFFKLEIRNPKSETNPNTQNLNTKPKNASYQLLTTSYENLHVQVLDIPHYSIGEQTKLLKYLNTENFDLVHFMQFNHPLRYRGKYVITIHDLTMIGHLHRNLPHKRIAFRLAMKSAVKNSSKIIAISKTTRDDLLDNYKIPIEKIEVIYHGMDHLNYNLIVKSKTGEIENFEKKYGIEEEYLLYTGMWKRHKNLIRLLKAYEIFSSKYQVESSKGSHIKLVLVGRIDQREPEIIREIERINKSLDSRFKIHDSIVTTDFITEEELPIAYAGAFAYVIPSLSEGFGWPPLEAMACGTPVIASKESSIPEICGNAPLYFDPYNIDDIADKMKTITTDKELRKDLIRKGLDQVEKYNWSETAEKTLTVYCELLEQS